MADRLRGVLRFLRRLLGVIASSLGGGVLGGSLLWLVGGQVEDHPPGVTVNDWGLMQAGTVLVLGVIASCMVTVLWLLLQLTQPLSAWFDAWWERREQAGHAEVSGG